MIDRVHGKTTNGTKTISSEHIENEMVTLTPEHLSSEDCLDTKLQANFDKYDQIVEKPE